MATCKKLTTDRTLIFGVLKGGTRFFTLPGVEFIKNDFGYGATSLTSGTMICFAPGERVIPSGGKTITEYVLTLSWDEREELLNALAIATPDNDGLLINIERTLSSAKD